MPKFMRQVERWGEQRFLGKVLRARGITVAEFDELRGARLSERFPADEVIFYLEIDDYSSLSGRTRSTFFRFSTAPVSKWVGFARSIEKLGLTLQEDEDGVTNLEGKVLWFVEFRKSVGPYGETNTIEADGIPTPAEIQTAEEKRKAALGEVIEAEYEEVEAKEAPPIEDLKEMILSVCEGKSIAETVVELADMGVDDGELVRDTITELIAEKRLRSRERKLWKI